MYQVKMKNQQQIKFYLKNSVTKNELKLVISQIELEPSSILIYIKWKE